MTDSLFLDIKLKIMRIACVIGMATMAGGSLFSFLFQSGPLLIGINLAGVLLLALSLIFLNAGHIGLAVWEAFLYFCFIYTPLQWVTLDDSFINISYAIYIFCVLIIILFEGKTQKLLLGSYLLLLCILCGYNFFTADWQDHATKAMLKSTVRFFTLLLILVFITLSFKKLFYTLAEQLHRSAVTDSLTNLYNQRYIKKKLSDLNAAYAQLGCDYCLALIDLDGFKQVNDQYGHRAGDEVLAQFGAMLQNQSNNNLAGRYGGDEFVILFENCTERSAAAFCDILKQSVCSTMFTRHNIPLSISVGLCARSAVESDEEIFCAADSYLYYAKADGKKSAAN